MNPEIVIDASFSARHLPITRWLFFFIYAGIGVNLTFLNVYYINQGLSGTQIGLIGMTASIVAMLAAAFWGYLSDLTGQARLIMAGCALGSVVIALIYPLVHTFPLFLLVAGLFAFFNTAYFILVDSTTLALLGDHRDEYGRYRLGGSIGYILVTAAAGFIFERVGLIWMFPAYAVIMLLFAFTAMRLPSLPVRSGSQHSRQLGAMIRQPSWIVFALCVFLIWIAMSGSINFLGITIKSMGGGDSLIGIAATMAAIAELPFMFFSGNIMRRIGMRPMLLISMFSFTLRIGLYSIMPHPAWAIGINLLNGPSYVFFWNSAVNYANQMAPVSLKATAQGLFQATTNLASMSGALLCGWMFDQIGPSGLFRVLAVSCLAALVIFSLVRPRPQVVPA